jgi:hypothetical protein
MTIRAMASVDTLHEPATALVEAAHAFHRAAEARGSHTAAAESLASLQEALQLLSAAWYRVAADASPAILERRPGQEAGPLPLRDAPSREQQLRLIGALHDVAAGFARCARVCRDGRSTVTPVICMSPGSGRASPGNTDGALTWFGSRRPQTEHVA